MATGDVVAEDCPARTELHNKCPNKTRREIEGELRRSQGLSNGLLRSCMEEGRRDILWREFLNLNLIHQLYNLILI